MPGSHSKKDKLKKKVAKIRKADQQDINRVKRWNSRSFNKKKELSGPTEPVFKPSAATNPLTARPHPGMVGDELVANLRNRLAKIENYNAEADPEAPAGEWINKYRKKRKNKIAKVSKQLTAGDYRRTYYENNPRTKSEIYKTMGRKVPPTTRKNAPLKKEVPFPKKKKRETETYGNVKIPANKGRTGNIGKAILRTEESKLESYAGSGKKIRPRKPSQKQRSQIIKARLANIRKADGGVAPNYNNPSKVRKKKTATKAAAKSKTGYLGDASVNIPWGEEEVNITLRDMAQFHRKNMWVNKQGTFPQIWNLGPLTGEGQGARQIFDAAHDVENRFVEDMGLENYQKNMQSEIDHLIKEYGEDPEGDLDFNEELTRTQDNLRASGVETGDVPQSRRNEIKRRQKKEKMGRQRKALRSAVNKGVNKVNPIKPTKKYKTKPPQGPNPHGDGSESVDDILKEAEVAGRKNDTYIGKIKKKKKKDDDIDVDAEREIARERMLERSQASAETQPQYGKIKKRIARIRKAGEQIDPRVKKRKTVRPDSPVQKVALNKRRIPPSRIYDPRLKEDKSLGTKYTKATKGSSPLANAVARKRKKEGDSNLNVSSGYNPRTKKLGQGPRSLLWTEEDVAEMNMAKMKDRIAEMKIAKDHSHSIAFRKHEGQYYRRASLTKQEGKYAKYWLLNAKQMNGNGWGVSPVSIAKNINKFIGRPFVVTAKQWVAESEYGDQFEHPYLPTNNIDNIIHHQEKFRVGSIVDVVEKDGDYHAIIEMNSKFANMMLPPFCSPAIFQNNPGEADGEISDWEALHLAGLMEDPAYGARIALLKGSCMGTAEACSVQFKGAKLTKTMCPKKKAKLVRRLDRLGD